MLLLLYFVYVDEEVKPKLRLSIIKCLILLYSFNAAPFRYYTVPILYRSDVIPLRYYTAYVLCCFTMTPHFVIDSSASLLKLSVRYYTALISYRIVFEARINEIALLFHRFVIVPLRIVPLCCHIASF